MPPQDALASLKEAQASIKPITIAAAAGAGSLAAYNLTSLATLVAAAAAAAVTLVASTVATIAGVVVARWSQTAHVAPSGRFSNQQGGGLRWLLGVGAQVLVLVVCVCVMYMVLSDENMFRPLNGVFGGVFSGEFDVYEGSHTTHAAGTHSTADKPTSAARAGTTTGGGTAEGTEVASVLSIPSLPFPLPLLFPLPLPLPLPFPLPLPLPLPLPDINPLEAALHWIKHGLSSRFDPHRQRHLAAQNISASALVLDTFAESGQHGAGGAGGAGGVGGAGRRWAEALRRWLLVQCWPKTTGAGCRW